MNNEQANTGRCNFRIKSILKDKGITYQQLADLMGVSLQAVRMTLCKDSVNTSTLEKISAALQVPVWQLIASPADVSNGLEKTPVFGVITVGSQTYKVCSLQDLEQALELIKGTI